MPEKKTVPRVVLADDHAAFASTCEHLLADEFDIVAIAHDGQEALDAMDAHDPDILVLDLSMPGMTGVEVLEALQERESRTRIVVLTVHSEAAVADRVIKLGAYGYVVKSRTARDLAPAIRAALAGSRFRSPIRV